MKKNEKHIYKEFALKERSPHRLIYSSGIQKHYRPDELTREQETIILR